MGRGPWDLVLFSGDLTQSATNEQFRKLSEVLDEVWTHLDSLGCNPVILCIPGNHDLSRPDPSSSTVKMLQHWHDEKDIIEAFWESDTNEYKQLIHNCFTNYTTWWHHIKLPKPRITSGIIPGDFSTIISKSGISIGVIGLNTTFLQLNDDNYEGLLDVHDKQLLAICGDDPDKWTHQVDVALLMTHHGPDWLHSDAKSRYFSDIYPPGRFFSHLYGHRHASSVSNYSVGGADERRYRQGPSLFGLKAWGPDRIDRVHGYIAGQFEIKGLAGVERLWPRLLIKKKAGHWCLEPDISYNLNASGCIEIRFKLKTHTSQRSSIGLAPKEKLDKDTKVRINAYKLFFFRRQAGMSFRELSKKSGVDRKILRRIERVDNKIESLEPSLFRLCERADVEKLEETLGCQGKLQAGGEDDFLSVYIHFYSTYKGTKRPDSRPAQYQIPIYPVRAIAFDFDGTLTQRTDDLTTWERIWIALGYSVNECAHYHRLFSERKITHAQWCKITLDKFQARGLTESKLIDIASGITLVKGTKETLTAIHKQGIKMYILSGSIKQMIKPILDNLYMLFEDVSANDMLFDSQGFLVNIKGTKYDFEGKADYLRQLIKDHRYRRSDVLFVGNSCNDIYACRAARTVLVNPHMTDYNNIEQWNYCIRKMDDLKSILQFTPAL